MLAEKTLRAGAFHRALWGLGAVLSGAVLALGVLCLFAVHWYIGVYGNNVGFGAVVNTLLGPLDHVEQGLVVSFVRYAALPAFAAAALLCFVLFFSARRRLVLRIGGRFRCPLYPFPRLFSLAAALVVGVCSLLYAAQRVGVPAYLRTIATRTTFLEGHYVDPDTVSLQFPENKRNVILICLESMETSFLSQELGVGIEANVIPELYQLARDNVNFSSSDGVGGSRALMGGDWTIGALVSITSGVPLKENTLGERSAFLPGLTTLSDILHENGYFQALMVGSDASFGGRRQYYAGHGTDRIYDLYTAYEDGIVPRDYFVWWGMEDRYLFQYAKQELLALADQDQPFAFSLLTVDTHHVGGYLCELCGDAYPEQYENVLACSSRQAAEFVAWIQQQDFYENTTVIITGDHCSMDGEYAGRNLAPDYDRRVYNCFINTPLAPAGAKNRDFSTLDLFPTILSSLGCTIPGDRLGLGTDLFSATPTLCEELGADRFNGELANYSDFFVREFL